MICCSTAVQTSAPGVPMIDQGNIPLYPMPRTSPLHPAGELAVLQETEPISKVRLWNGLEAWLFTRHADVKTILSDVRVSADSERPGYPQVSPAVAETREQFPTFLQMDPPEHAFYRRMVTMAFSVKASEARRAETEQIVDDAIDAMLGLDPPVDFIEEFALVVPSTVISTILGVPYEDHDFFQSRSKTLVSGHTTHEEARIATDEMRKYLDNLVTAKDRHPGDDLLSKLIVQHMRAGEITHDQVVATARLLLTGGHDTTASMIGLGTLALLLNPDELAQLRADRSLLRNSIEEMLRFFTITHIGRRRIANDTIPIGGCTVMRDEGIIAAAEIANRDPRIFTDPNAFDVDRDTTHHIAFGFGPHQCLGQNLARVELQVVFDKLIDRIPTLRLAAPLDELAFKEQSIVYGLEALPVTW
jgi:cytochrome P450